MEIARGKWETPHRGVRMALDTIAMVGIVGWVADTILDQLSRAGLLVRQDYYVPSREELYNIYGQVDSAAYRKLPFRWVMCAETLDAISEREKGMKLLEFSWNDPSPDLVPIHDWGYVIQTKQPKLFDIPIRIDPAARRPMIELVEKSDLD